MQLSVERAALLNALGHVQNVVERRNTIPILSNVLLSADDGALALSATDLDMEIIDEAEARVVAAGQVTAPAHTLYEIVRKLPEGAEVELAYAGDDPRLQVTAGRSRFSLPVLPAGDFPVMSAAGLGARFVIDAKDLIRLIDNTRFAMSSEETRYYLCGLYLHSVVEGGQTKLRAVATDGHRLALAEMLAPEGSAGAPGVIIPRKTVAEVRRLLEDAGESVEVQISAQKVRFDFGRAALTSKVIDGAFPDYPRVIEPLSENNRVLAPPAPYGTPHKRPYARPPPDARQRTTRPAINQRERCGRSCNQSSCLSSSYHPLLFYSGVTPFLRCQLTVFLYKCFQLLAQRLIRPEKQ
jgi:DNA polymerase-3 subunit beta